MRKFYIVAVLLLFAWTAHCYSADIGDDEIDDKSYQAFYEREIEKLPLDQNFGAECQYRVHQLSLKELQKIIPKITSNNIGRGKLIVRLLKTNPNISGIEPYDNYKTIDYIDKSALDGKTPISLWNVENNLR